MLPVKVNVGVLGWTSVLDDVGHDRISMRLRRSEAAAAPAEPRTLA